MTMNKKLKLGKKPIRRSPLIFEDEEMDLTSSQDEVQTAYSETLTPKSRQNAEHSTPIRSKCKVDSSESPDLNFNDSPIEPLTQNPPNEVGWDYQRPKENGSGVSSSIDAYRTPKRSNILLSKKRNSNSPIFYKPLKKKLIQEEQKVCMAGFMKELQEIQSMAKKKQEERSTENSLSNKSEQKREEEEDEEGQEDSQTQQHGDMNGKLFEDSVSERFITDKDDTLKPNAFTAIRQAQNPIADDSMEDIMVLCSQEVEAKAFGLGNKDSTVSSLSSKNRLSQEKKEAKTCSLENKNSTVPSFSSKNGLSQEVEAKAFGLGNKNLIVPPSSFKSAPSQEVEAKAHSLGSKNSILPSFSSKNRLSADKKEIENNNAQIDNNNTPSSSSESKTDPKSSIPDDFFDEILFDIDEKELTEVLSYNRNTNTLNSTASSSNTNTTSKGTLTQNKFFVSKNPVSKEQPKPVLSSTTSYTYTKLSNSKVTVQSKIHNKNASFGYLNKDLGYSDKTSNNSSGISSQASHSSSNCFKSTDAMTFRAKSFTDSNLLQRSNSFSRCQTFGPEIPLPPKQETSSSGNNYSSGSSCSGLVSPENKFWRRSQSSSSLGESRFNAPNMSRPNVYNSTKSEKSQSTSTRAEIERKRQEAIMKRKARMKLAAGSNMKS